MAVNRSLSKEDLEKIAFVASEFGSSAQVNDTIKVPADPHFDEVKQEIGGQDRTWCVVKDILYNGKNKESQSVNFARRGKKSERSQATNDKLANTHTLLDLYKLIAGTTWKCVHVETNPFGTTNATWDLVTE